MTQPRNSCLRIVHLRIIIRYKIYDRNSEIWISLRLHCRQKIQGHSKSQATPHYLPMVPVPWLFENIEHPKQLYVCPQTFMGSKDDMWARPSNVQNVQSRCPTRPWNCSCRGVWWTEPIYLVSFSSPVLNSSKPGKLRVWCETVQWSSTVTPIMIIYSEILIWLIISQVCLWWSAWEPLRWLSTLKICLCKYEEPSYREQHLGSYDGQMINWTGFRYRK